MKRLMAAIILAFAVMAGAQEQQSLTNDSVLKMVQAGLGESVIVAAVQTQPGKYSLGPDDLIKLKQAGVSERILTAMLKASAGTGTGHQLPIAPVKITRNTPVRLTVDQALSSASAKAGDTFKLTTADDLVVDGHLVIAKGTTSTGKVVSVKKKQGFAAYDGLLEISIDAVPAVNGQNVPLDGHTTIGGGAVGFGRKGHEGQLDQGQVITVHVLQDTTVD